jgi:hypothetical protein
MADIVGGAFAILPIWAHSNKHRHINEVPSNQDDVEFLAQLISNGFCRKRATKKLKATIYVLDVTSKFQKQLFRFRF